MSFNFDQPIDRLHSDSIKWNFFPPDVLPMWVADMDFRSPDAVVAALHERVAHGVFGYPNDPEDLKTVLVERMRSLYGWEIRPEWILFMTGVVSGLNISCHALARPGESVLVQTPVYQPILEAPGNAGLRRLDAPLIRQADGRYSIDFEQFENSISPETRLFILCSPHNPVGRVFRREELERLAEICQRRGLTVLSDEIHCDLILPGHRHIPFASLSPEVSATTVTLMAPSKTFNVAGLKCSFAIVSDPDLRNRLRRADQGMAGHNNLLGFTAALAAYRDGAGWLADLLAYLEGNRRLLETTVREKMPELALSPLEGTYLAWLDCRSLGLSGERAADFFRREARVGLNDGEWFGPGGDGFVRINIGCPRSMLTEALERMSAAIARRAAGEPARS